MAMARDDGAFVVAVLCERALEQPEEEKQEEREKRDTLRKTLSEWFDKDARQELEAEKEKLGRTMLLEQLAALSVS